MEQNKVNNIFKDIIKLRTIVLVFLIVFIVPAIILDIFHAHNPEISQTPVFITFILLTILAVAIGLFVLLFATCPKCKKGYF